MRDEELALDHSQTAALASFIIWELMRNLQTVDRRRGLIWWNLHRKTTSLCAWACELWAWVSAPLFPVSCANGGIFWFSEPCSVQKEVRELLWESNVFKAAGDWAWNLLYVQEKTWDPRTPRQVESFRNVHRDPGKCSPFLSYHWASQSPCDWPGI